MARKRWSLQGVMGRKYTKPVLFVVSFAAIGLITLLAVRAATPTASLEPESATATANAVVVNDSTASGGQAIQFKSGSVANGCVPLSYIPAGFPNNCTTGYK